MDFFAHQESARRRTRLLVALYATAVAGLIGLLYLVAWWLAAYGAAADEAGAVPLWRPDIFLPVALATLAVIGLGTLYKIIRLSHGGRVVALELGGRRLEANIADPAEKRLLNIVEEMALAAGTPIPEVFLLDLEPGINAFAAGFTPQDAVIGVTRGAVERLTRDELQGVIAHEFSHIVNGDMRLNLRLIGVLHGILVIALIGSALLRSVAYTRIRRPPRRDEKKGGDPRALIALTGLALLVIGWIGVFFARLIQAAVSRQREFLADAAGVQFTRNPYGLAGALRRIADGGAGARLNHPRAAEAGHLLFADGLRARWLAAWATHPPLTERIARLENRGATLARMEERGLEEPDTANGRARGFSAQIGRLEPARLAAAATRLSGVPPNLLEAAEDTTAAPLLLAGFLLDTRPGPVRETQLAALRKFRETWALAVAPPLPLNFPPELRLPFFEHAIPALRRMRRDMYPAYLALLDELIAADGRIVVFEMALRRMLRRRLAPVFARAQPTPQRYHAWPEIAPDARIALSALAHAGHGDAAGAKAAFDAAWEKVRASAGMAMLLEADAAGARLDSALDHLAEAAPRIKRTLLDAAAVGVATDGVITPAEGDLLRVVADALDCPAPLPLPALPSSRVRS